MRKLVHTLSYSSLLAVIGWFYYLLKQSEEEVKYFAKDADYWEGQTQDLRKASRELINQLNQQGATK